MPIPSATLDEGALQLAPTAPPAFRIRIRADRDRATVVPGGELDFVTVPILEADLRDLRVIGYKDIVVDLRELTFIDGAGARLLVRWAESARRRGHDFRLIPGADRVQLAFKLVGLLPVRGLEAAANVA